MSGLDLVAAEQAGHFRSRRDGSLMVWIPPGEFLRGSTGEEVARVVDRYPGVPESMFVNEIGASTIHLGGYFIDVHPVTNEQYRAFQEAGGYAARALWSDAGWTWLRETGARAPRFSTWPGWSDGDRPVVGISWYEADAFARFSGKRLPTEAEWEKAARGPDGRRYPWGDSFELGRCNTADHWLGREIRSLAEWEAHFVRETPWRKRALTTRPGAFPSGMSVYGAHDMAGNVWEWCADWYEEGYYTRAPDRDPVGPSRGAERVCRGGSFGYFGWSARTTDRGHHVPGHRSLGLGVRCAATGREA